MNENVLIQIIDLTNAYEAACRRHDELLAREVSVGEVVDAERRCCAAYNTLANALVKNVHELVALAVGAGKTLERAA